MMEDVYKSGRGKKDLVNQQLSFEVRNIFCWNELCHMSEL